MIAILFSTMAYTQLSNLDFKSATKIVKTANGVFPLIDIGTGTPVLLLHGFPDSKELWKNQIPVLVKAGFRVIAPDLRGYGNSPSPLEKEKYAFPILMADVMGILDRLSLEKVHIIGHDWGAALSWQLAKYHEHKFISLTVMSVGFPGNTGMATVQQREKQWYFYLFLQEGLAEKKLADYDWKLTRETFGSHPELEKVLKRFQNRTSLTTALNWYRGNLQNMLTQAGEEYIPSDKISETKIKKIVIPTLGIWSSEDNFLLEEHMQQSAEFTKNFSYRKIEGAGHWMMLDKPKEINSLILEFLNSQK